MISLLDASISKKYNLSHSKIESWSLNCTVLISIKISFNRIKYNSMRERNLNKWEKNLKEYLVDVEKNFYISCYWYIINKASEMMKASFIVLLALLVSF
jgi:hypothetical protein